MDDRMTTSTLNFPPGPPQINNMLEALLLGFKYQRDMLGTISEQFRIYGDTYAIRFKKGVQIVLSNPDHIHQVLVTDAHKYHKGPDYSNPNIGLTFFLGNGLLTNEGEFWKRQRRLIQPAFHARRIEAYADTMVAYAQQTMAGWRDGMAVEVDDAMMNLALNIVAKTLFSSDVSGDAERIGSAMTVLQHMAADIQLIPHWVPTPARFRRQRALRDLDAIVYRLIAEWRESGDDRGDLLSMLLLARDDDGEGMTDKQVRDEAVTIMLAGHETTANAMNWTWVLLAQNPDVEAKLHDELDRVLGDRPPTLENLKRLPYTDMVVKESMRLYPPAYGFSRWAIEDTQIGNYDVPKGSVVGVSTYATHHDPRWWDAPERFLPERFSEESEKQLPRYAYLPFGGGPRVCIGNSFAMMEARLLLATMAQRYRLRLAPGQIVGTDPLITLRPKGGLRMTVEDRKPTMRGGIPDRVVVGTV